MPTRRWGAGLYGTPLAISPSVRAKAIMVLPSKVACFLVSG
jgi:hypothetical protein